MKPKTITIREQLIAAHLRGDQEAMRFWSQEKEHAKKTERKSRRNRTICECGLPKGSDSEVCQRCNCQRMARIRIKRPRLAFALLILFWALKIYGQTNMATPMPPTNSGPVFARNVIQIVTTNGYEILTSTNPLTINGVVTNWTTVSTNGTLLYYYEKQISTNSCGTPLINYVNWVDGMCLKPGEFRICQEEISPIAGVYVAIEVGQPAPNRNYTLLKSPDLIHWVAGDSWTTDWRGGFFLHDPCLATNGPAYYTVIGQCVTNN